MQGKFSGVQITQANGEPGGGMAIRIRGAASVNGGNSPLVVVDGFPITPNEGTGLESISPEEIENLFVWFQGCQRCYPGNDQKGERRKN